MVQRANRFAQPQYEVNGQTAVMVIRAFDKLHGLHRGTGTKTFMQSKDSDMVQTVAREAGLRARLDSNHRAARARLSR